LRLLSSVSYKVRTTDKISKIQNFLKELNLYSDLLNKELDKIDFGQHPKELYDPIRYILTLGGKRMRPILALLAYTLYKDRPEDILRPALAVEVFHNFTLMHDDIMDNAPLRMEYEL
jgi:geranylgeranyl diphosphate synthase type II